MSYYNKTKKLQKTIFIYISISILILGILIASIAILPLYDHLREKEKSNLLLSFQTKALIMEEYFKGIKNLGLQVASRSAIRNMLEDYNRGYVSLENLIEFCTPKLQDAIDNNSSLESIYRFDVSEEMVLQAGKTIPPEIFDSLQKRDPVLFPLPIEMWGQVYIAELIPIHNRNHQFIGEDLLIINTQGLYNLIKQNAINQMDECIILGYINADRTVKQIMSDYIQDKLTLENHFLTHSFTQMLTKAILLKEKDIILLENDQNDPYLMAFGPLSINQWGVLVLLDNDHHYEALDQMLIKIVLILCGILLLGIVGAIVLLKPLSGKMILHTDELQKAIKIKTKELEKELTERQRIEEILTKEREQLLSIFDSIDELIYVADMETYEILYCNKKFIKSIGYSPIGKKCYQVIQGKEEVCDFCTNPFIKNTNGEPYRWEYYNSQFKRYYLLTDRVIKWPDGRDVRFQIAIDISNQKNLEKKLLERGEELKNKNKELQLSLQKVKEMQNQIVLQEKLASLGGLTAGIAHELKNPLNFINNFASLAQELIDEIEEVMEEIKNQIDEGRLQNIITTFTDLSINLTKIEEHGRRADSIIKRMLLHSRGENGKKQNCEINNLLRDALNLVYHSQRASNSEFNISIETHLDKSIKAIKLVEQDISRAMMNIIDNACYAAYAKKIDLSDEGFQPKITIISKNTEDYVVISIKDNGKGIPESVKEKVFEPFYTTKPPGVGTGLGLSLSYDIIVNDHNGIIEINTIPLQYTEFIVKLPKEKVDQVIS